MLGSATLDVSVKSNGAVALLAAVNRFKFLKPVAPGQTLRVETKKLTEALQMAYISGTVWVDGEIVANGELAVVSA
jgi:3-hydroxymyristoyl/3-hydroxydecanoyl-(acyl carrier protein) dehydratase